MDREEPSGVTNLNTIIYVILKGLQHLLAAVSGTFLNARTPGDIDVHTLSGAGGGWICAGWNVDILEGFSSSLTDTWEEPSQKQWEIFHKLSR